MQNGSILESELIQIDFITQPQGMRERLIKLSRLRSETGAFVHGYYFGSCDIFPLWFISAAVAYMKESGDYGILEEIPLQSIFNAFNMLSGSFAAIMLAYKDGRKISIEDTISIGLFLCVCKEYLELCRFLEMSMEAASAAVRLKWISDFKKELFDRFGKAEWLPYINELLGKNFCRSTAKGHFDYRGEINQFIRSGIFEIMRINSEKDAQNYWITTSSVWSRKATAESIYGIKPGFNGLFVSPCLPDGFENYAIKRVFRNAVYDISVIRSGPMATDIEKLVVDNTEYLGNLLPNFTDGKTHRVVVTMGNFE